MAYGPGDTSPGHTHGYGALIGPAAFLTDRGPTLTLSDAIQLAAESLRIGLDPPGVNHADAMRLPPAT